MKAISFWISILAILCGLTACGGPDIEARFFTEGNCQECGEKIVDVLEDLPGLKKASWDLGTKQTSVVYDGEAITLDEIQQALADQGFNTQFFDGQPSKKQSLPACCLEPSISPPQE